MQKGPSQVSSGNIAPAVVGPEKDMKDVWVLSGLVLFLSGLIAVAWYYGQTGDQDRITSATEKVEPTNVSELLKHASAVSQAEASTPRTTPVTAPVGTPADIIHADVYFETGRKGLTDEGKALLTSQATLLKEHAEYGVLIQGYTDQQGSAGYNMKLGLKRAETVKTELLNHEIVVESMGGDTQAIEVSATKKMFLDKLEEAILLQAELLDLKANPDRLAEGVVVADQHDGRTVRADVLLGNPLHVGDRHGGLPLGGERRPARGGEGDQAPASPNFGDPAAPVP